jgi:hypothetical protein
METSFWFGSEREPSTQLLAFSSIFHHPEVSFNLFYLCILTPYMFCRKLTALGSNPVTESKRTIGNSNVSLVYRSSPKEAHPGTFPFFMGGHNPP